MWFDYNTTIGLKYNRLTVLEFKKENGNRLLCLCECGNKKWYGGVQVITGHSKSCGCLRSEKVRGRMFTHGLTHHPLRDVMSNMYSRCYCEKSISYPNYGGRGINICKEWLNDFKSFFEWAMNNGWEKGLQIDRINNDGHYCPENCRIVTRKENNRNKRSNKFVTYKNKTLCVTDWAISHGIVPNTLRYRIKKYGVEKAFNDLIK